MQHANKVRRRKQLSTVAGGKRAQGGSNRVGIRAGISRSRIRQDSGGATPTGRVQKSGDICYGRNEGALVFLDRRSRNG